VVRRRALVCAGCHGQNFGEISPNSGNPKSTAYGLRSFHVSLGYTQCGTGGCHSPGSLGHSNPFPIPLGEAIAPTYYSLANNNLGSPCSSGQEDLPFDLDSVGLDNDGDGFVDLADADCIGWVSTTTLTTTTTTTTTLPVSSAAPRRLSLRCRGQEHAVREREVDRQGKAESIAEEPLVWP